jgi:hypothetical protein
VQLAHEGWEWDVQEWAMRAKVVLASDGLDSVLEWESSVLVALALVVLALALVVLVSAGVD